MRAVLIGLVGVVVVCGLSPYNDFAAANTFLTGNHFPIALTLFLLVLVLGVNVPLARFAPRLVLRRGELAVAMSMTLLSCTLPSSGLMRYLIGSIAGHESLLSQYPAFAELREPARLNPWLFPTINDGGDPSRRGSDPVIANFVERTPDVGAGVVDLVRAVPWSAWMRPAVMWGTLAFLLFGAVLCLAQITYHQWARNERLPFPIAEVYLSLVEPPAPGRALNATLGARSFWISASAVFLLHAFSGLHDYYPRYFGELPLYFDLRKLMTEVPWRYLEGHMQTFSIHFLIIGFCFFMPTSVSLSLWSFVVLIQVVTVVYRLQGAEFSSPMKQDFDLGAMIVMFLGLLYVGRKHWWCVIRQMGMRPRDDDPRGDLLPYRFSAWMLVLCSAGLVAWTWLAGASVVAGVYVTAGLLATSMLLSRIIAETGVPHIQFAASMTRPLLVLQMKYGELAKMSTGSFFVTRWVDQIFTVDPREAAMPHASHAVRLADRSGMGNDPLRRFDPRAAAPRGAIAFVGSLLLALVVGYLVAGASMLIVEYNFGSTMDVKSERVNIHGVLTFPKGNLDFIREYVDGTRQESHNPVGWIALGGFVTLFLLTMRYRSPWWPLHPVGLVVAFGWPMTQIWFSCLLGWLLKRMLLWIGGATLLDTARPACLGLIVGEATAAAFWLLVGLTLNLLGVPYYPIRLLPS